jgi:aspartyl-tRNA(Asn)/glutamyl-tRNA(Gln) amidotransferase subunit C
MSVSREDVARSAALARVRLSADEADRLTAELNDILAHVETIRSVAVERVTGLDVLAEAAALRADVPGADPLLAAPETFAPEWRAGFFTVPRLAALEAEAGGSDDEEGSPA